MRVQDLPGEPIMWVLIASELLVFAAGITAMAGVRLTDPAGFAAAQAQLHGWMAALNTAILVSSGFCAALAEIDLAAAFADMFSNGQMPWGG